MNGLDIIAALVALGSGLMAGVFFAFSSFIMRALSEIPAGTGHLAMQKINVTVLNWHFLGIFFCTALLSLVAIVLALLNWREPGTGTLVMGGMSYLIGTFGVTVVCNVPLNNALRDVAPESEQAEAVWNRYLSRWTFWNHVRTVAGVLAMTLFLIFIAG